MSKSVSLLSFVVIASLGIACAAPTMTEEIASSTSDIIGGTADFADPAVVFVLSIGPNKEESHCTGEVIASRWVLTAAHCVDPRATGFETQKVGVISKQDVTVGLEAKDVLWAQTYNVHPQYDPAGTMSNDIALLELVEPTSIKPLPLFTGSLEKFDGSTARAVGFGTTIDGDAKSGDRKNEAKVKISRINAMNFFAAALPATQCHGDSGGPILLEIDGKEMIVGIGWRTVRDDGLCSDGILNLRVDPYVNWINAVVKGAQQDPAPNPGQNGGGEGGGSSNIACCVNGQSFDCPTSADCLGGVDVGACIKGCADTACILACTNQVSDGHGPTNACRPAGTCN